MDLTKKYWKYCDDVLKGRIVTGNLIKLACKRMIDFDNNPELFFDYEDVDRKIRFIERMTMTKGLKAGEKFILLPYQAWILANIFGWKYKKNNLRVTRQVLIMVSRQQGKSYLSSAIALACLLCDNEPEPSISFLANSADQARILFGHCKSQAQSLDPRHKIFRMLRQNIFVDKINGAINVLSADTSKLDGRADSCAIIDEFHAAKSGEIFDVMRTGQGSRKQPLIISCTTAGFLVGSQYPLYSSWENCCNILKGVVEDLSWFSAIYQLDEDDDWQDEKVWAKAAPSLGEAVDVSFLKEQILGAKNNPRKEVTVKTKNLNMWCQSADAWLSSECLDGMLTEKVDLADFEGDNTYGGLDLSTASDLTSFALLFPPNSDRLIHPDKFVFKPYSFIPDIALEKSQNKEFYKYWIEHKEAHHTKGNVVDFDVIKNEIMRTTRDKNLLLFAYDPYKSQMLVTELEKEGMPMVPFKQGYVNYSKTIQTFEILAYSGKVVIDKSSLNKWCFNNCMIVEDRHENQMLDKANRDPKNKIDPVVAMLMALGAYLSENSFDPMIYTL